MVSILTFYDCETTGLNIYYDNTTKIAANIVGMTQFSASQPSFSSLVDTPHHILKKGSY